MKWNNASTNLAIPLLPVTIINYWIHVHYLHNKLVINFIPEKNISIMWVLFSSLIFFVFTRYLPKSVSSCLMVKAVPYSLKIIFSLFYVVKLHHINYNTSEFSWQKVILLSVPMFSGALFRFVKIIRLQFIRNILFH